MTGPLRLNSYLWSSNPPPMIRSMTGYGKASRSLKGMNVTIEIRTLNSKQLDLSFRLPYLLSHKEAEMRQLVSERLGRGKISVNCSFEKTDSSESKALNHALVLSYYQELKSLAEMTGEKNSDILAMVMRMPDVTRPADEELSPDDNAAILEALEESLAACDDFRLKEGKALAIDMDERVNSISSLLVEIEPYEAERLERIRKRIRDELSRHFKEEDVDRSRFEQELVYYLEKLDITEEKVRLAGHCKHFLEALHAEQSAGKKLGFISQEMGREINTIGSKANDLDMQKLVVQMKDELEKIKEQTLNIL